jgi:predicted ester cyclase
MQIAMFPDRTSSAEDIIAKGDKVIVRSIVRATYEGDVEDFPTTGSKIEVEGIEIVRVENGKIVESWASTDNLGMMQQLGFELKPKEGEK